MSVLRSHDGSSLSIRPEPAGEILETRDARGRLIFEYDVASGRAVLYMPNARVHVRSCEGAVELASEQAIRIRSGDVVDIEGARGVRLSGPRVAVQAECLEVQTNVARLEAQQVQASAQEAKTSWGRLEQSIGRFVQLAREMYVRVESLLHTRAGRVRTESDGAFSVRAQHARIQCRQEVSVTGNEINLG